MEISEFFKDSEIEECSSFENGLKCKCGLELKSNCKLICKESDHSNDFIAWIVKCKCGKTWRLVND